MPPAIAIIAAVGAVAAEAVAGVALAGEAIAAGAEIAAGIGEAATVGEVMAGVGEAAAVGETAAGIGDLAGIVGSVGSLADTAAGVIADGSLLADAATGGILGAGEGSLVSALVTDGAAAASDVVGAVGTTAGDLAGTTGAVGSLSVAPAVSSLTPEMQAALAAANAGVAAPLSAAPIAAAAPAAAAGSGIGSALAGALGVGTAAAAGIAPIIAASPIAPASSGMADIIASANAAANQGTLTSFLANNETAAAALSTNPSYLNGLNSTNNSVLAAQGQQSIYASQPGQAIAGSPTGGATLGTSTSTKLDLLDPNAIQNAGMTGTGPSRGLVADQAFNANVTPITASSPSPTPAPAPTPTPPPGLEGAHTGVSITGHGGDVTAIAPYQEALTNAQRDALAQQQWTAAGNAGTPWDTPATPAAAPSTGSVIAPANNPVAATPSVTPPIGGVSVNPVQTAIDTSSPTATSSTTASGQTYTGIGPVDSAINSTINNPGAAATNLAVGMTPLGIPNTISGVLGGPTVGGIVSDIASGIVPSMNAGTAALGAGLIGAGALAASGSGKSSSTPTTITPPATQDIGLSTPSTPSTTSSTAPAQIATSAPSTTALTSSADMTSALRQYLGLTGDPTKYGFGAEQQFYSTPAAANGGYFDSEQYFADGGMVQPLSAPTTPLVSTQPTMAFTDGAGPVGSIAQPPGLSPNQSVGFDATTASPMAPSVAAAAPSVQPGLATLAMPSTNANPVPSQIAQNPNVGYALGNSPLSNLTGS